MQDQRDITITYPRHRVEYESVSEMLDVELDKLLRDEINMDDMNQQERENAVKVLEHYKKQIQE